jgi:molecular chaperone DnaK
LDEDRVVVGPSFSESPVPIPSRSSVSEKWATRTSRCLSNKKLTPEFISALILKKMKQDAEKVVGPIANAVITVPYSSTTFAERQLRTLAESPV